MATNKEYVRMLSDLLYSLEWIVCDLDWCGRNKDGNIIDYHDLLYIQDTIKHMKKALKDEDKEELEALNGDH